MSLSRSATSTRSRKVAGWTRQLGCQEGVKVKQFVTNSELSAFRNCSQKHGFRYRDGLRPVVEAPYFADGRIFHEAAAAAIVAAFSRRDESLEYRMGFAKLAAALAQEHAFNAYLAELQNSDGHPAAIDGREREAHERNKIITGMVERLIDGTADDWETLLPVFVEQSYKAPIPDKNGGARTPTWHAGAYDVVWYDRERRELILEDHKTTSVGTDSFVAKLDQDPQMTGYLWGLKWLAKTGALVSQDRLLGYGWKLQEILDFEELPLFGGSQGELRIGRIRYNVVRKKLPTEPHVLKKGLVSTARLDTTSEVYEAALQTQEAKCLVCTALEECKVCEGTGRGQPRTPEQEVFLRGLRERPNTWFSRLEVWRSDAEIDRWIRETRVDARRIRELDRRPELRTRNLWHCTGPAGHCEFSALCAETSEGNPIPDEFANSFRRSLKRHEELELGGENVASE